MRTSRFAKVALSLAFAVVLAACSALSGRETAGEYVDDTAVSTKVKAALVRDPVVKASQINVETMQGVVQLSGFVDSQQEVERAAQLARSVEGVRQVRNDIIVRSPRTTSQR